MKNKKQSVLTSDRPGYTTPERFLGIATTHKKNFSLFDIDSSLIGVFFFFMFSRMENMYLAWPFFPN
ncbi:hypothetical protein CW304_16955 [Bacillus sp. UFRGS-B20]|nr:hypothetical protein CW304_16955 [Bacillus sp. UFRGS-B20]